MRALAELAGRLEARGHEEGLPEASRAGEIISAVFVALHSGTAKDLQPLRTAARGILKRHHLLMSAKAPRVKKLLVDRVNDIIDNAELASQDMRAATLAHAGFALGSPEHFGHAVAGLLVDLFPNVPDNAAELVAAKLRSLHGNNVQGEATAIARYMLHAIGVKPDNILR